MADKPIDIGLILFFGGFCMLYKRRMRGSAKTICSAIK